MFKEFKEFAIKGNVVDLAVGVVIGAAFTAIVSSLVGDIIMPVVGMLTSGIDFANLFVVLSPIGGTFATIADAEKAGAVIIKYGLFINAIIKFVIVAFAIFIIVKQINKLKKTEAAAPAGPTEIELLTQIRDSLKK